MFVSILSVSFPAAFNAQTASKNSLESLNIWICWVSALFLTLASILCYALVEIAFVFFCPPKMSSSLGFFPFSHADCHSEFHCVRFHLTRFQWIMANNQFHGTARAPACKIVVCFCRLHLCVHRVRLKTKWHHFKHKCFRSIDGICKSSAFIHAI